MTTTNPGPVQPWWKQAALWIGAVPLLLFLVLAAVDLSLAQQFTSTGKTAISQHIGSLWQWMVVVLFLVAMGLAISPIGRLRLGGNEARPSPVSYTHLTLPTILRV